MEHHTLPLPFSSATATMDPNAPAPVKLAVLELVDAALRANLRLGPGLKAISLLQPWASLVAFRLKHLETRSWNTAYRGPLAIAASLGKPSHVRTLCEHDPYIKAAVEAMGHTFDTLPRGGIVAVANLQLCKRIMPEGAHAGQRITNARELDPAQLTPQEYAFGDYSPGRFAWVLQDVLRLAEPVPAKGALSLWEVPKDVIAQVQAAVKLPA